MWVKGSDQGRGAREAIVAVDLEEVIHVLVLSVAQDVEAQAVRFILFGPTSSDS